MATYAWLDRPRPPSWRRFLEKFGDAQIKHMGVTVTVRELVSSCTPEKVVRTHRHLIAFKSRFDSMTCPSMDERRRTSWEWTESE
jgi:hypothetical protein